MKLDENTKKKIAEKIIKKFYESGVRFTGITDESIEKAWKTILKPIKDALDEVEI